MKIKVKGIPKEGLKIAKSLEPAELGLTEDDVNCLTPLEIHATVERIQNAVSAQVQVNFQFASSCSRCLEDVEKEISQDLKFDYEVDETTEYIDLGDDIRQEIIVGLPVKVLCSDDCKGICLHCGANLNEEECDCGK